MNKETGVSQTEALFFVSCRWKNLAHTTKWQIITEVFVRTYRNIILYVFILIIAGVLWLLPLKPALKRGNRLRQRISSGLAVLVLLAFSWTTAVNSKEAALFTGPDINTGSPQPAGGVAMVSLGNVQGSIEAAVPTTAGKKPQVITSPAPKTASSDIQLTNSAAKTQTNSAAKAETKPVAKAETKPAAKTEAEPAAKTAAKPVKDPPSSRGGSVEGSVYKVLELAYSFVGTPYVRGGASPRGFDCSGFTGYVYRHGAGISLPRTTGGQAGEGTPVFRVDLMPGDIVYFNTDGKGISHVGIYAGDDSFIHASYIKGITVTSLSNSYYKPRYLGARRIIN